MEPIESNSVLSYLLYFAIVMILYFIGYYIRRYGKSYLKNDLINESEYEAMYLEIQKHILVWPVDLGMYYEIKKEIWRLKNLKWKNEEKTEVLQLKFYFGRFLDIALSERKKRIDEKG